MEALLPIAPTSVGDYMLGPLLGRGGMSEVYACTHATHGDRLALKLLRDDADGAFQVEAATREVVHPNVVRVVDAALDPATRRYFLVMERLDGPDLATHLAGGPLDERTARALFAAIADGMHAVHAHGIVHRDLKPANVMLHAGAPRIVDFGIAKRLGENAALVTSRRIGTLGYMAPEQLVGGRIAPGVDVWALGVMLFEAVTGRLPFGAFSESYSPQLVETAPRVRSIAQVSPAYDALVAACLDADPTKRPPMAYIARALRGEVAIETSLDERVTQDIGAIAPSLPGASLPGASLPGASSSGASSSGASRSSASFSSGHREEPQTGNRAHEERALPSLARLRAHSGKPRLLAWTIGILSALSVIAIAAVVATRGPSMAANTTTESQPSHVGSSSEMSSPPPPSDLAPASEPALAADTGAGSDTPHTDRVAPLPASKTKRTKQRSKTKAPRRETLD